MKRILLLSLFGCFTLPALYGQEFYPDFYPSAFTYPKKGQNQLEEDNSYLVVLKRDASTGDWKPNRRFISQKAPNTSYKGINITSYWVKNQWGNLVEYKSEFVLDTQNRIDIAFVDDRYFLSKKKCVFAYNAQNKVSRIDCYASRRDTLNNYQIESISYFQYDQTGKQIKDSVLDYLYGTQRVTYYQYIGNNLIESDQVNTNTGDSIDKYVYTYSGNLNTSYSYLVWDTARQEWDITYSDTFEYNTQQQIIKRESSYTSVDLGDGAYRPRWQETYQYTDQNKLREFVISKWSFPGWSEYTKTAIGYSSSGSPEVGFRYYLTNGYWSPSDKYLFEVPTGIEPLQKTQSTLTLYPNPATSNVTIASNGSTRLLLCELYDLTGKRIASFPDVTTNHTIDISQYPNGIYYIRTQNTSGAAANHKLIIGH